MSEPQLEPGQKLSSSELDAIRRDNERESLRAREMAYQQAELDRRSGRKSAVDEVQERMNERIRNGDITKGSIVRS